MDAGEKISPSSDTEAWAKRYGHWCVAGLVVLALLILWSSLGGITYATNADEGFYLRYVQHLTKHGFGSITELIKNHIEHREYWWYPPPTRVAYLFLATLLSTVFAPSFQTLSYLSLLSHLALIVINYVFARRHLGCRQALLLTTLVAFSPLWLGLGLRALTDGPATCFGVLTLWLWFEHLQSPRRGIVGVAFVISFALTILIKELSCLLVFPFAVSWLFAWWKQRQEMRMQRSILFLVTPPLIVVLVWATAAGGLSTAIQLFRIVLAASSTNPFTQGFYLGPWYRPVIDFIALSPWVTLLAFAAIPVIVLRQQQTKADAARMYFVIVLVGMLVIFGPLLKNARFVAVLDLPLRVLTISLLCRCGEGRRYGLVLVGVAVVALVVLDYFSFMRIYVDQGVYDPTSYNLLGVRKMIPWG